MKVIKLILQLALLILLVVLFLNNMQLVEFNFYGIWLWRLPLIMLVALAIILGMIAGFCFRLFKSAEQKLEIHNLKKELDNLKKR